MDLHTKATKERVRRYLQRQQAQHRPPLPMEEIRRQLGWDLLNDPAIKKTIR